AVAAMGSAYVTGTTYSTNFPTMDAFKAASAGPPDAFVTRFQPGGSLQYSSYLGGGSNEDGFAIAVDASANAYVTGTTFSTNFPTTAGAFKTTANAFVTAFVAKIGPKATPTLTTAATPTTVAGGTIQDTATLAGATPTAGGTITFTLVGPIPITVSNPCAT